jgi:hypothetical protein
VNRIKKVSNDCASHPEKDRCFAGDVGDSILRYAVPPGFYGFETLLAGNKGRIQCLNCFTAAMSSPRIL